MVHTITIIINFNIPDSLTYLDCVELLELRELVVVLMWRELVLVLRLVVRWQLSI